MKRRHGFGILLGLAIVAGAGAGAGGPLLERLRGEETEELRLIVNIPANRMDVYENGEPTRSYWVSVGTAKYRTPRGKFQISQVIWNPWWHPPDSEWARKEKLTPPGRGNPMGRAKLHFATLLYIHGTPYVKDLGEPASHGCIRMANAGIVELARLVHQYGSPGLTEAEIVALERNEKKTRTIWLKRRVALEIRYDVAEVREGELAIYPDVYGMGPAAVGEQVVAALAAAGYDVSALDVERMRELVDESKGRKVAVGVDALVAGEGAQHGSRSAVP